MLDMLDMFPPLMGGSHGGEAPIPDPRSGEGPAPSDPLHVGRDDDHSTKAGEHLPDVGSDDSRA